MESFERYLSSVKKILDGIALDEVERICDVLFAAYERAATIFVFGNGGSAALASHFACDLGKGTHAPCPESLDMRNVARVKVLSLTDNVPMMTAWANDASYQDIFAEQIDNFIKPGDVAFGISGSGNSPNVLNALRLARKKGATTVGFTGYQGGKMKDLLDLGIVIPSNSMQQIEDAHLILAHLVFLNVRDRIQARGARVGNE